MLEDIRLTTQAGSQGGCFGALTADKKLDKANPWEVDCRI